MALECAKQNSTVTTWKRQISQTQTPASSPSRLPAGRALTSTNNTQGWQTDRQTHYTRRSRNLTTGGPSLRAETRTRDFQNTNHPNATFGTVFSVHRRPTNFLVFYQIPQYLTSALHRTLFGLTVTSYGLDNWVSVLAGAIFSSPDVQEGLGPTQFRSNGYQEDLSPGAKRRTG